jgi:hypothetical protein
MIVIESNHSKEESIRLPSIKQSVDKSVFMAAKRKRYDQFVTEPEPEPRPKLFKTDIRKVKPKVKEIKRTGGGFSGSLKSEIHVSSKGKAVSKKQTSDMEKISKRLTRKMNEGSTQDVIRNTKHSSSRPGVISPGMLKDSPPKQRYMHEVTKE